MLSIKRDKYCSNILPQVKSIQQVQSTSDFSLLLEQGRLYQFEFRKREVGAYRSIGAKRDKYGSCYILPLVESI